MVMVMIYFLSLQCSFCSASSDSYLVEMNSVFFYETLYLQLPRLTVAFKVHKVEALSNFAGDQPEDLSFKKGDVLTILDPR